MSIDIPLLLRRYALAAAIVVATYAGGIAIEESGHALIVNTSPSMLAGVYWIARDVASIQRGNVVMFAPPDSARALILERGWLPDGMPLLKTVGALAGDTYCVRDGRFIVSGNDVGPVYLLDTSGRPLPQIAGCRRVRDGQFLPVADVIDRSFDGRYMGAVSIRNVLGTGRALVTF